MRLSAIARVHYPGYSGGVMLPALLLAVTAFAEPDFDPALGGVAPFRATTSKAAIETMVKELVAAHFDRLPKVPVEVDDSLESDFDFFQAHVKGVMRDWDKRVYVLKVNKKLYAASPGDTALRGILAHELAHLDEYTHSSTFKLAGRGWDYSFSDDNADVIAWERATDEKALGLGYARGLKAYRLWLYAQLTEERAAKKKRVYYTPEQIDAWVREHPAKASP